MGIVISDRKIGYFPSYILQRIRNNKNFICAITGSTGSGKSWSSLRLGETLDPDFDIRNLCFGSDEFMDLINGKTKQLRKGSVIIFDEIQVSMSHLDYQSLHAKLLNYVMQTFRHRNFILFMTTPHFSFINASLRKLFHSRIETVSIDVNNKICMLKPFLLQVNQKKGDVYEKYLRVVHKEFGVTPLKSLKVSKPSLELIKQYEIKKNNFTSQLNESISRDINKMNKIEDKPKKPLTNRQSKILEDLLNKMRIPEISIKQGIHEDVVRFHMRQIEKKGINIIAKKKGKKVLYYHIVGYDT